MRNYPEFVSVFLNCAPPTYKEIVLTENKSVQLLDLFSEIYRPTFTMSTEVETPVVAPAVTEDKKEIIEEEAAKAAEEAKAAAEKKDEEKKPEEADKKVGLNQPFWALLYYCSHPSKATSEIKPNDVTKN